MIRPILAFLITVILAGFVGFATRQFILTGRAPVEVADMFGIAATAAVMLVLGVFVTRQARED